MISPAKMLALRGAGVRANQHAITADPLTSLTTS